MSRGAGMIQKSKKKGKTVSPREAVRLLTRKLGAHIQQGEWANFNCPFRHDSDGTNKPDTKKRLGINLKTGWFNCHRCGRKGLVASEFGVNIDGATIYVTASPCWNCFKSCANAGIKRICYREF